MSSSDSETPTWRRSPSRSRTPRRPGAGPVARLRDGSRTEAAARGVRDVARRRVGSRTEAAAEAPALAPAQAAYKAWGLRASSPKPLKPTFWGLKV